MTSLLFIVVATTISGSMSQSWPDCGISRRSQLGNLGDPELTEASGLEASNQYPGVLYSHNDHGDDLARVFAFNEDGSPIAQIILEGQVHQDFEDITIAVDPDTGVNYIFVGDIGNNDYDRDDGIIIIPESDIDTIYVNTEKGATEDMETLMFDPDSNLIYILTKNHDVAEASIYKFPANAEANDPSNPLLMTFAGTVNRMMLTAGDISNDGTKILLRRAKNDGAWMWEDRILGVSIEDTLTSAPDSSCWLPLEDETKPESIAAHPDGLGFYGVSEGPAEPLYFWSYT